MCEVLDRVEAKGKAEGLAKGKAEGKIIAYYDVGYSVEQIAEKVGISEEKVQEILALQQEENLQVKILRNSLIVVKYHNRTIFLLSDFFSKTK